MFVIFFLTLIWLMYNFLAIFSIMKSKFWCWERFFYELNDSIPIICGFGEFPITEVTSAADFTEEKMDVVLWFSLLWNTISCKLRNCDTKCCIPRRWFRDYVDTRWSGQWKWHRSSMEDQHRFQVHLTVCECWLSFLRSFFRVF